MFKDILHDVVANEIVGKGTLGKLNFATSHSFRQSRKMSNWICVINFFMMIYMSN